MNVNYTKIKIQRSKTIKDKKLTYVRSKPKKIKNLNTNNKCNDQVSSKISTEILIHAKSLRN